MLLDAGCAVCGHSTGPVCAGCNDGLRPAGAIRLPGLDGAHSTFLLNRHARELIASFKYKRQRRLAAWLADRIGPDLPMAADCITWVPSTPARRRRRGYDQAQELAHQLANRTGVPAKQLLARDNTDVRQTGLDRRARLAGPVLHLTDTTLDSPATGLVVIVDDVVTTGASLRAAAELVRVHHGCRVFAVTAAATPLGPKPRPSASMPTDCV